MRFAILAIFLLALLLLPCQAEMDFMEFRNPHPDSHLGSFGETVVPLANGNVVVTSPGCDAAAGNAGAVHLFKGSTGELISSLYGSHNNDKIGSGGVMELPNGHFVVISPDWGDGGNTWVGAVTWVNGETGANGQVSSSNSLVGSSPYDRVGDLGIVVVGDSNYVVKSRNVEGLNGGEGAATWCDGSVGGTGNVSSSNSLIGSRTDEVVTGAASSDNAVMVLPNGNYLVFTENRDGCGVTWASGNTGITGTVSATNSLVGSGWFSAVASSAEDVQLLPNGNCVILSSGWDRDGMTNAGAATWCSATSGVVGEISPSNSLVGASSYAQVGRFGVNVLANGNYLVSSTHELTWCDGTTGKTGEVNANNSLTGYGSSVAALTVVPFTDGNYLICDPEADIDGVTDAGAVTWFDGSSDAIGAFDSANSFVGSVLRDRIGDQILQVADGNYVILGSGRGTSTFVSAGTAITGVVSTANSLMWPDSFYNEQSATVLTNGNYVLYNPEHRTDLDNQLLGAVLWCDGTTGRTGLIQTADMLLGNASDEIGDEGVVALPDGNYVVLSSQWKNGSEQAVGAATWCSGTAPTTGALNMAKTSIGSAPGDSDEISCIPLHDGNYLIVRPRWDQDGSTDHGAITWCPAGSVASGEVTPLNSVVGGPDARLGDPPADGTPHGANITVLSDGDYVVGEPYWSGLGMVNNGALRWCSGIETSTGELTESNSIIGAYDSASIGKNPVLPLPTGGFVTRLRAFNGDPSGVAWGDGNGYPTGVMTNYNSLMSPAGSSSMYPVLDHVNEHYYGVNSSEEPNGKVKVGSYFTGGISVPIISVERSPGAPMINDLADVYFDEVPIGGEDTRTLHITNLGSWPLELGALSVSAPGTDVYLLDLGSLDTTVHSGLYTTVPIAYTPTESGNFDSLLSIPSNDLDAGTFRVRLLAGINQAPSFVDYQIETWNSTTLAIPINVLHGNASDPESRIAWIELAGAITSQGGSVMIDCGNLIYTSPSSSVSFDSFSVTVHDAGGLTRLGTVNVDLVAAPALLPGAGNVVTWMSSSKVGLNFMATPNELRGIEISQDLVDWQRITSVSADSNGRLRFVDHGAPLLKAFYRTVDP